jgi:hypothetical protein
MDINHYRKYICNIESPHIKARELRITRSVSLPNTTITNLISTSVTTDTLNATSITSSSSITTDIIHSSSIESDAAGSTLSGNVIFEQGRVTLQNNNVTFNGNNVTFQGDNVTFQGGITASTLECPVEYGSKEFYTTIGSGFGTESITLWNRDNVDASRAGLKLSNEYVGPTYQNNAIIEGVKTGVSSFPNIILRTNDVDAILINSSGDVYFKSKTTSQDDFTISSPIYVTSTINYSTLVETQIGYTSRISNPINTFPVAGTNVAFGTITIQPGVYWVQGQLSIQCTPSNTATVNKVGISIKNQAGTTLSLSEDRTNFAKQISNNTHFTYSISYMVTVNAQDTLTLYGYVDHTGTNTNVRNFGGTDTNYFAVTRIT